MAPPKASIVQLLTIFFLWNYVLANPTCTGSTILIDNGGVTPNSVNNPSIVGRVTNGRVNQDWPLEATANMPVMYLFFLQLLPRATLIIFSLFFFFFFILRTKGTSSILNPT